MPPVNEMGPLGSRAANYGSEILQMWYYEDPSDPLICPWGQGAGKLGANTAIGAKKGGSPAAPEPD